jgi:fatty-acyl-CoA synthase
MQDFPLTIGSLFRHGRQVYARSRVVTYTGEGYRESSFGEVAARADRLAHALNALGIGRGDRVGTFCWNNQEHQECYLAVPSMGAVLHTVNIRLAAEQLAYVINHAQDKVLVIDGSLWPVLSKVRDQLTTVEHLIVIGAAEGAPDDVLDYETLLAAAGTDFAYPEDIDERSPAAMCYTSGTTGEPKGVVYSHRSVYLHSLAEVGMFSLTERDNLLAIVPMFHVNAWGLPYAGWMSGIDFLMPARWLQAEPLCRMIAERDVTFSVGVPTVWSDILRYADAHDEVDFSRIRSVIVGGAAVPRTLIESFQERHGLRIIQAWGMTETSPLGLIAYPPKDAPAEEEFAWRARTGRIVAGVEMRITDQTSGEPLAWDGKTSGEIEVRGPWITASYYDAPAPDKFHDGWLRTGDAGMIDDRGFVQITDRTKDVIKSGGEWISSIDLENAIMGHPDVLEAAVIGVPDPRWDERPLACVVVQEGASLTPADLIEFLSSRVAKWWLPERWSFIEQVPKTSVGKFDKKLLRARFAKDELPVAKAPD